VERSDLIGRFFSEFLTREGGDELYLHLGRVLETRERQSIDLPISPAGDRHLRLESAAAADQNGGAVCRTAVTDITERKQTDEKLREAMAAAEEASRVKSEFLANMSHEIRTPMTVFMAAIEHLLLIDRHPERRNFLEMANQSAERLRILVDDILDFSRIEARKVELEEEAFDLRACVREAVNMFTLLAKEKNLRLDYGLAPEIPERIVGDPGRLGQVLINLIDNAVKFTPAGEINVRVQPRGDFLEFSITDTGIGIPEEKRDLLFQSFSQADSSFTRPYGGTGLGLAISKGLVELMGGEIAARSHPGKGSVFTFTLPLKTAEKEISVAEKTSQEASGNHRARILVVDDEPMIRKIISMMLARHGWQAEIAESGGEAVAKWEKGKFDLILMDLQMPEINGMEATRAIRERETGEGKRICIIGLTGHARRDVMDDCLKAGMDRVLTKPVQMNDLQTAINFCLSEQ
jgi:signal transduction histidine kinase/ActR/RegA family two-component response regulator